MPKKGAKSEYAKAGVDYTKIEPESLGNKNWIAEWMYQHAGTGRTYYEGIGIDTALMAANDVICQGALPVIYTDEVAAGDSEWFMDERRSHDLAESFYQACEMCGMALPAGESPALRYLVKAELPVRSAPSLSGCVTGIIVPRSRMVTGEKLAVGDRIVRASCQRDFPGDQAGPGVKRQVSPSTAERQDPGRGSAHPHPLVCPARRGFA